MRMCPDNILFLEDGLFQLFPGCKLNLFGSHHDECDLADLIGSVMPHVVDALLDEKVARLEGFLFAAVQLEDDLARQHDGIVDAEGAVHRRAVARCHVCNTEGDACLGHAGECFLEVLRLLLIIYRHRCAGVEYGERTSARSEGRKGFDHVVRVEHGGSVLLVGRDHYAGTGLRGAHSELDGVRNWVSRKLESQVKL